MSSHTPHASAAPQGAYLERLFGLTGRTAVVVGGTGVLGGALAEGLAAAGAFTIVAGRGEDRGQACVERIRVAGGEGMFLPVDATDRASVAGRLAATRSAAQARKGAARGGLAAERPRDLQRGAAGSASRAQR